VVLLRGEAAYVTDHKVVLGETELCAHRVSINHFGER